MVSLRVNQVVTVNERAPALTSVQNLDTNRLPEASRIRFCPVFLLSVSPVTVCLATVLYAADTQLL